MVDEFPVLCTDGQCLSVLALSSRFDGLEERRHQFAPHKSFSTRSVESF